MKARTRAAARLVIFDDEGRVLLLRHVDRTGKDFWATPGGGLEPGETEEQAARREAAEELGAADVQLTRLWTADTELMFANHSISQTETFFLMPRPPRLLGPSVAAAHRDEGIVEVRWWSLEEIAASQEPLFPTDLAERIRTHVPRG